jgi:hypothetical protein
MLSSKEQKDSSSQKPTMSFDDARAFLTACFRDELVDHAFGDAEIGWHDADRREVATGYIGNSSQSVSIRETPRFAASRFVAEEARELRGEGMLVRHERNDGNIDRRTLKGRFSFGTIGDLLRLRNIPSV